MRRLTLKRSLLAGLLLCASLSFPAIAQSPVSQAPGLPLKPESIRFAVIGDSGSGDRAEYETAE